MKDRPLMPFTGLLRTITGLLLRQAQDKAAVETRAGNLAMSILLSVIALPFFALVYLWFGDRSAGVVCLLALPGVCLTALLLRRRPERIWLARRILTFDVYFALLALTYQLGGVGAPCLVWLMVCPMLACATGGARSAVIWSATVMLTLGMIYLLDDTGFFPAPVLVDFRSVSMIGNIGFVALVAMFLMVYEANNAAALSRLGQAVETIGKMAISDDLTGLHNRRELLRIAHQEKLRADRYGSPLSYCLIDIDHFKTVNDTWGHFSGDEVLRTVAGTIDALVRATDSFGRYGGEEFILVLSETGQQGAIEFAERIRVAIEALRFAQFDNHAVTISVGVAQDLPQQSVEQGLARADAALYQAKRAGRNRVVGSALLASAPS